MPLCVLSGEEEARLSFVGATRTMATPAEGTVAVVDVGGGSSELAIGVPTARCGGPHRSGSGRASSPTPTCAPTRPRSAELRRCAAT